MDLSPAVSVSKPRLSRLLRGHGLPVVLAFVLLLGGLRESLGYYTQVGSAQNVQPVTVTFSNNSELLGSVGGVLAPAYYGTAKITLYSPSDRPGVLLLGATMYLDWNRGGASGNFEVEVIFISQEIPLANGTSNLTFVSDNPAFSNTTASLIITQNNGALTGRFDFVYSRRVDPHPPGDYLTMFSGSIPFQGSGIQPPNSKFTITTTPSPTDGGTISGGGLVNSGTVVTLTASPAQGWSFVQWTENGTSLGTTESLAVTATGNRAITGVFTPLLVTLKDLNANSVLSEGDTAWITAGDGRPEMPHLFAIAEMAPSRASVKWDFVLQFNRPLNNPPRVGDVLHLKTTGRSWDIRSDLHRKLLGGDATLTCTIGSQVPIVIHFHIAGANPEESTVLSFADKLVTRSHSGLSISDLQNCFRKILRNESQNHALLQFYADSGQPVVSSDNGVGISQITVNNQAGLKYSLLPGDAFWDWQKNVELGWATLTSKISPAKNYPATLRNARSYHAFIRNVINPARQSAGLKQISGAPAPNYTTVGLIGQLPKNLLLEDIVRLYNGIGGSVLRLNGAPIVYNNGRTILLHEFAPDVQFLLTVPDSDLHALDSDARVWRQVPASERPQPPSPGTPDYVQRVIAQPSN